MMKGDRVMIRAMIFMIRQIECNVLDVYSMLRDMSNKIKRRKIHRNTMRMLSGGILSIWYDNVFDAYKRSKNTNSRSLGNVENTRTPTDQQDHEL